MVIQYISGSEDFGLPLLPPPESPKKGDYLVGNFNVGNGNLVFSRQPAVNEDVGEIKPILGLGLRKAFLKASKEVQSQKIHIVNLRREISTITELEKSMVENKSGATILALSGLVLAGPVGILAGLAAKKKGEVVFAVEFRKDCKDTVLNGKVLVLSASETEFQTMKKISKAPSKTAKEFQSDQSSNQDDSISAEIEKLSKLKDSGAINEEEFAAAKTKLLGL